MKEVFIVKFDILKDGSIKSSRISTEAYDTYEKAVTFIESRYGNPVFVDTYNGWIYKGRLYTIIPMSVK